jgi:taurine dioxygenase
MKIQIHENGWTVMVEDFDIKDATDNDVHQIAKYLLTNTVVVFKNQSLTPSEQSTFCNKLGQVQNFLDTPFNEHFILSDGHGDIVRVTGELNEHGQPGMFGHVDELEWHCNRVSDPDRMPIVWLYADRGTKGSRTSWLNNIVSYNDLSEEKKQQLKNFKLNVGNTQQFINYYNGDEYVPKDITNYRPNLVHTNKLGVTGLFFSWNQTHFIEDMPNEEGRKLIEELKDHCEQQKYIYDHDWEDGDIVVSDQWLSIHKRWRFEEMHRRVLHRIACDYSNVNFDKL